MKTFLLSDDISIIKILLKPENKIVTSIIKFHPYNAFFATDERNPRYADQLFAAFTSTALLLLNLVRSVTVTRCVLTTYTNDGIF